MIQYEEEILQSLKKRKISKEVFQLFNNAFIALDVTKDLNLFDIKKLKSNKSRTYYNKFRAIFYIENGNYYVVNIAKREEVYKQWE